MNLKDEKAWTDWEKNNTDPYGKYCIDVARRVMELLDEAPTPLKNADELLFKADKELDGGLSGFQAGCVAQMVSHCHIRGDEFRRSWNKEKQIGTEGDKANEGDGVLNPALLNIHTKE